MTSPALTRQLANRADQIADWLDQSAPYVVFDQCHLDAGTPAQAYWHLGYQAALHDALALIAEHDRSRPGSPSRSLPAGPDE